MKCYWCGKENKNLEIDQEGNILKHFPCNDCNQPDSSKREDFPNPRTWIKGTQYKYKKLKPCAVPLERCGARNTAETS